jgi:hypothetical protein
MHLSESPEGLFQRLTSKLFLSEVLAILQVTQVFLGAYFVDFVDFAVFDISQSPDGSLKVVCRASKGSRRHVRGQRYV